MLKLKKMKLLIKKKNLKIVMKFFMNIYKLLKVKLMKITLF